MFFVLVCVVYNLNLFDAFATQHFLSLGYSELNPLMDWVIQEGGMLWFFAYKSVVSAVALVGLYYLKEHTLAKVGIVVLVSSYAVLTLYHAYGFITTW